MLLLLLCFAACVADRPINAEIDEDVTSLLQVSASQSGRARRSAQVPISRLSYDSDYDADKKSVDEESADDWNGICHVTFRNGQDCSAYRKDDAYKMLSTWNWQSRICKTRVPPIMGSFPDVCLWQGCHVQKNLEQGAFWYMQYKSHKDEIEYCFKEHCGNVQFDISNTSVGDAHAYCDKKYGSRWRKLQAGPHGLGWPGEGPGTGLWECAHENYHCDWAYCKLYFCDKQELRDRYCGKDNISCAPFHSAGTHKEEGEPIRD